jgi:hypothetical protein
MTMHSASKGHHNAHALRPQIGEVGETPLDELCKVSCGPDDMALEIDDLAEHFLLEATQATATSRPPQREETSLGSESLETLEASLGTACFEGEDGRDGQRAFERLWRSIIQRELATAELE